jgi:FMN phosphatase YigB (HAD superfamily)
MSAAGLVGFSMRVQMANEARWGHRAPPANVEPMKRKTPKHRGRAKLVFLFDVDNTLLDNDRVTADLKAYLKREVGPSHAQHYWQIFERLRTKLGYADYLGALQLYRTAHPLEMSLLAVSRFFIKYPFARRLFPRALDVITRVKKWGPAVVLTDGDVVFQPHKVDGSGLYAAVGGGRTLIYVHKEHELADVEARFPSEHYVLVDDKLRILTAVKKIWKQRVTTVFVRQGHYALDPKITATYPAADVSVDRIGDLLNYERKAFGPASQSESRAKR